MRSRSWVTLLLACALALGSPPAGTEEPKPAPDLAALRALMAEAEFGRAEEQARAALVQLEADHPDGSAEIAEVLDVLVESRWRSGKGLEPETREFGERSLEMKKRLLGPQDAGVGKTLHHLAILAYFHGEYTLAGQLWEQAIAIREAALGAEHPDVAESMNGLANLYQITGEFDEALSLYESAVEIRRRAFGPDDPVAARTLNNLGALLMTTGDYAAALPIAEQALEIKRNALGPDHVELAYGYLTLGQIFDETGDWERAREYTQKSLEIWEAALGPDNPDVAPALNSLAEQHERRGEYAEALPLYERALAIWEKADPEHHDVGLALSNLGEVLQKTGQLEQARVTLERSVANRETALGADHPDVANSLSALGKVQAELGLDVAAEETFARSLEIRRNAYGDRHPFVADALEGLALAHARQGETAQALTEAIEAETVAREHLRLTGRSLSEEHALDYARKRDSGLDLALTLAVERGSATASREVLDATIRSRAVVLDEMAARNRSVSGSANPQVARLAERLTRARARLANLTVRGLGRLDIETYRRLVDEAEEDKEKAERALGAASAEFAREQQLSRLGLNEVQQHIPANGTLVSFRLYEHQDLTRSEEDSAIAVARYGQPEISYAAIVLHPGSPPRAVRMGTKTAIDSAVAKWKDAAAKGANNVRRTPQESESVYRVVAQELRERVWDAIEPLIGNEVERLFVVPDGSLNLVTLASLPSGERSYLIETGPTVHYLSAERDLVRASGEASGHGMLALGGPDYDATAMFSALSETAAQAPQRTTTAAMPATTRGTVCSSFRSLNFEPLPAAAEETGEVTALWSLAIGDDAAEQDRSVQLVGDAATEEAFKRDAVGRRLLHIATHGFFLGGDCAGGEGTRGFNVVKEKKEEPVLNRPVSPLLLSGLAMAGANHRDQAGAGEEDGVLTAEEIAGLDLSGVEWAVLSACDTGVGEIEAGEGVFGLRRAMQVAGVRTLIMSLWPVDDKATRQWMNALYRGRLERRFDSAEAVRHAGKTVLLARRQAGESTHPFYWAAFVGAGDWH